MQEGTIREPLINEDLLTIKREYLKVHHKLNKKRLLLVRDLKEMGFGLEMIDMCFCFFNIQSLEQAVQYMTKENNVWQHNYIPDEENLCIVCRENSDHLNYKINQQTARDSKLIVNPITLQKAKSTPLTRNISNNSIVANEEGIISNDTECQVCFGKIRIVENKTPQLPCKHNFCSDCWLDYLEEKIINGKVLKITCMMKGCMEILDEDNISKMLENDNKELLEKFRKFKISKLVLTDNNLKFCPVVNCGGFGKKDELNPFITCSNGHQFCFICSKKWHGTKKCDEMIDEDFEQWKKGKLIKKCPRCQYWTEKNEGCNHMTCRACSHQWCWICQRNYTENHYTSGQCSGLQYSNNSLCHNFCCRITYCIIKPVLTFFTWVGALLLFLLLGSSILAVVYITTFRNDFSHFQLLLFSVIVSITAIMFQPLLIGISTIILGIGLIVCILYPPLAIKIYKKIS